MLPCFECGVCSLFQLQAWTDLEKQTKPNLQPNVLEAWTTQSGLSATVAHTCEDCTWSPKLLLAFASVFLFGFWICWCTGLAFQRRVWSIGKTYVDTRSVSCTKVRTYLLLRGWTRTFYRMTVIRLRQRQEQVPDSQSYAAALPLGGLLLQNRCATTSCGASICAIGCK